MTPKEAYLTSHATGFKFGLVTEEWPNEHYLLYVERCLDGYRVRWLCQYVSRNAEMVDRDEAGMFGSVEDAVMASLLTFSSLASAQSKNITMFTLPPEKTLRFYRELDKLAMAFGLPTTDVTAESLSRAFEEFLTTLPKK